ncbi:MAG: helix-turn-helix domain-containing protein, partial [Planctomycetota bacterium]|nr:helix-turn-helix domain-containing protein [Planctomycetota bacterium]
ELDLLRFLVAHEGRALSRARILEGVWGGGEEIVSRVVDTTILNLRKKVEKNPARPRHILSVRGVGYRFSRAP